MEVDSTRQRSSDYHLVSRLRVLVTRSYTFVSNLRLSRLRKPLFIQSITILFIRCLAPCIERAAPTINFAAWQVQQHCFWVKTSGFENPAVMDQPTSPDQVELRNTFFFKTCCFTEKRVLVGTRSLSKLAPSLETCTGGYGYLMTRPLCTWFTFLTLSCSLACKADHTNIISIIVIIISYSSISSPSFRSRREPHHHSSLRQGQDLSAATSAFGKLYIILLTYKHSINRQCQIPQQPTH